MTKLPEKDLLDGSKKPVTTTGEMKNALGKLRDYLAELFGDDSANKEKARQTLGIDLSALSDKSDIEAALSEKADRTELAGKADKKEVETLEAEIAKRGVPVGSIDYFATTTPPPGYLKADGSAVGRETYPELFAAIGMTFGNGDGETTFNLPDLMGRFAQGDSVPGQKIDPGLPNITGSISNPSHSDTFSFGGEWGTTADSGALASSMFITNKAIAEANWAGGAVLESITFNASASNSIYGASNTVQPPSLTLLPCIKAFNATVNQGSVDITELANSVSQKIDKTINNKPVRYVVDTYSDGGCCGWRKWSDGFIEQWGGLMTNTTGIINVVFYLPFSSPDYYASVTSGMTSSSIADWYMQIKYQTQTTTGFTAMGSVTGYVLGFNWYACGMGEQG